MPEKPGIFRLIVRRPVATSMVLGALAVLGVISYLNLPVQLLPDFALPIVRVFVYMPSYSVEEMEEKIVLPIEAILAATPRTREIESYVRPEAARIWVYYEYGTDMRFAQLDLQEKVAQLSRTFGKERFHSDVVLQATSEWEANFMWCVIRGPADEGALSELAEERVEPILSAVDGVASVEIGGGRRRTIDVIFQTDLLDAYGISIQQAAARLRGSVTDNFSLGSVQAPGETCHVILRNRLQSLEDIRQTPIDERGVARLSDVAVVVEREREPEYLFRHNGKNSVGMTILKEAQSNPLQLARKVKAAIAQAKADLPPGFDIEIILDMAQFIEDILKQMTKAGVVGALLAMGVLLVFLRRARMSLIVVLAIPYSIITTFSLMYFWGLSINVLTLLGLAFTVGLLVDNSIVVLENIHRHYERSGDPAEAAERGARQVWRALVATTATNLVVFVPVLFAEGEIRLIFREGALAVTFPQVMSLLAALALIPMLAARMLLLDRRKAGMRTGFLGLRARLGEAVRRRYVYWPSWRRRPRRLHREFYGLLLRAALRHRVRLLFFVALVILLTYHICLPMIRAGVMQSDPQSAAFAIYLQTPSGSELKDLERAAGAAEEAIARLPEVKSLRTFGNVERGATIYVELKKAGERKRTTAQIQATILDEIGPVPGAVASLNSFDRDRRRPVDLKRGGEVEIQGTDDTQVKMAGAAVAAQIEALPEIARAELESQAGTPECHFLLDRERAALLQAQPFDVARLIQTTQGEGLFSQLYLEEGDHRVPIYLRSTEETRSSPPLEEVQQLRVLTQRGEAAPLKSIGRFVVAGGERRIMRHNFQRIFNLSYYLEPGRGDTADIHKIISDLLKTIHLPAGVTVAMAGERRQAEENVRQVFWMIGTSAILIYMVMAAIFESLLTPLVIMVTLPLAFIGVFWTMALGGIAAEELAMFGMLVMGGIVVNNGILLLDFVSVMRREHGWRRSRAVLEACYARLRPILMTTLTTVLGLLPMALKHSEDFPWSSLAIVVIAGLSSSTLLTLFVVPAMLMSAEDAVAFLRKAIAWFFRRLAAPPVQLLLHMARRLFAALWRPWRRLAGKAPRPEAPGAVALAQTAGLSALAAAAELGPQTREDASRDGLQVTVRQVYMTYPVFHPRKLGRIVPSRRYRIGCRPIQGVEALRGIDLRVERGMCGLLGPNGAGKTTLMQILAGLLTPTRGYVEICGVSLAADRERGRRQIGYLPQHFGVPAEFTARQFLDFHALTMGLEEASTRRRRIEEALDAVNLRPVANQRIGGYSGGMKQRLGIARVLLKLPKFLIVDEPTAGLDPIERVKFRNLLARLSEERIVLFSTHIIEDISVSCARLAVLHEGRIAYQGAPAGLTARLHGHVWEFIGSAGDRADLAQIAHVLWQRPREDGVHYRLICPLRPRPTAQPLEPTIEDAYMSIILATRQNETKATRASRNTPNFAWTER